MLLSWFAGALEWESSVNSPGCGGAMTPRNESRLRGGIWADQDDPSSHFVWTISGEQVTANDRHGQAVAKTHVLVPKIRGHIARRELERLERRWGLWGVQLRLPDLSD
jgi:hypothetical protein